MTFKKLVLFWVIATLISCTNQQAILTVLDRQVLTDIPSASGIARTGSDIYVIGDNTPWIYRLTSQFELEERMVLLSGYGDSIIPKNSKPDLEAITPVQWGNQEELLVFGSGSKSPERDVLIRFRVDHPTQTKRYSLKDLYGEIKSITGLNDSTFNIEAAAIANDQLFLFNREENNILRYNLREFISYLEGNRDYPTLREYTIKLPALNGVQAKFSGATCLSSENLIVFTASVENNLNPIADGEILGSYVGIIPMEELKDNYQPDCVLPEDKDQTLKIKVESVEVLSSDHPGKPELLLVTDSDGGASELIRVRLAWK